MKRVIALLLALVMVVGLFAGCDNKKEEKKKDACDHEWQSGTCDTPRTCTECGKTMGTAKGHKWAVADCTTPRSCTRCSATEGEALGHTWKEATCLDAQVCTVCEEIGEAALGHDMAPATIEAPATCKRCEFTEGLSLGQPLTGLTVFGDTNSASGNDIVLDTWTDTKGNTYENALRFWVKNATGFTNEEEIHYELNGEYTTLKCTVALGSDTLDYGSGYITIYADGYYETSSATVSRYTGKTEFEIDVTDVDILTIKCSTYSMDDSYIIFDAQIHK